MEICTPPTGGWRTRLRKESGNVSKTVLSMRRTDSPIDGCSSSSASGTAEAGIGGASAAVRPPGV
jgi:hypothetical protein